MENITLSATERQTFGRHVGKLRREGMVPAVLYGHNVEPISLTIPQRSMEEVLARAGSTRLIRVVVDDSATPHTALVRDVQRDSISRALLHVDLYEVSMTEKIRTQIPIVLVGKSPALDMGLGILVHGLGRIEVEALPGDLIPEITVDISTLAAVRDSITVRDLKLSDALTILANADDMIATIAPMAREEVAEVAAEETAEPTVVRREKAEEEE